jgi:hypothetical protein
MKANGMEVVLVPNVVYFGDNGRAFCGAHAGASAKFTGRDLTGQKVVRAPKGFKCETCEALARQRRAE